MSSYAKKTQKTRKKDKPPNFVPKPRALIRKYNPHYTQKEANLDLINLKKAEKNSKIVDENRVNVVENFSTRKRYDLILDVVSALTYSPNTRRVLGKYATLLREGGSVLSCFHET